MRRERFVDVTAGVVAARAHPLHARRVTPADLTRYPWIDFDAAAAPQPGDPHPSLPALLEALHQTTHRRARTLVRSAPLGLWAMATGPYLAWLSLTFLERLPGAFLRPLATAFGQYTYRSGFVARRSAEHLAAVRHLEAVLREIAIGHRD